MMDQLSRRSRVPLLGMLLVIIYLHYYLFNDIYLLMILDLPWDRPWYLVDLREHYDLELLVRFYQVFFIIHFLLLAK